MTRQRAFLAVAALFALGLLWFVLRDGGTEPRAVESPAPQARAVALGESALDAPTREVPPTDLATPTVEEGRVVSDLPEFEVEAPETELAHIVGRFLLPGGEPAADVILGLHGWGANTERRQKYEVPESWSDLRGTTDAEGRFDLAFDPPRAYRFTLRAYLEPYAELSWRWNTLPRREVTDVGEQIFVATGTIVGRVARPDGSPTGTDWVVYGYSTYGPTGEAADWTRVFASADSATGAFRLEGLPPGSIQVHAQSSLAGRIDDPVVRVRAGEETRVDLVYDGPEISRRIVVGLSYQPFFSFGPHADDIVTCTAADGRTFASEKSSRPTRSHSFEDLDPGTYTIEITSPRFQPWSQPGVRPGEGVTARLKGNAAITLVVRDAQTGEEVVDYGLRLRFEGANFTPNIFQVREPGSEHPVGGLYEGLIPFDTTLIVQAAGFATLEIPVGELAPGTTLQVESEVVRGGALRGVVMVGAGIPVEGATVLLHPHLEGYDPDDTSTWPRGMSEQSALRSRSLEAETDTRGRFLIEGIAPGDYDVRATAGSVFAKLEDVTVVPGATQDVVLRLPGTGAIVGRLSGPPQTGFVGLRVFVLPAGVERARLEAMRQQSGYQLPESGVGEAGRFRLAPVREGQAKVFLSAQIESRRPGIPMALSGPGYLLELGEVEVRAGEETRVDFDLTQSFPGAITLDVRVNGERAPSLVVVAAQSGEARDQARVVGHLDAQSRVRLFPLFIGDWDLYVWPIERSWTYRHPVPVPLGPAGEVELTIDIIVAGGRVRILDVADGTPLVRRNIWVVGVIGKHITDADGWIDLRLTPGTYELRDTGDGEGLGYGGPPMSLNWTSAGPDREEVRLTRVKKDGP